MFCHFFSFVLFVENQLEKITTPHIPSFLPYAWARLFTREAQSTGAPFHPKHWAQPADPLSLPAGPASTAVIILRTAQVESDCREIPPPLPVLKSFTLPQVNQLISLPISELFWLCSRRPRSRSSLQQPAAPAQRLPSCQRQARAFHSTAGSFPHSPTPCAGKATRCWPPSLPEETRNLPALLQKPGTEKGEQEAREAPLHPRTVSAQTPALIQVEQDAAGEQGGSPLRGDQQAVPFPAGCVSWNSSTRRAWLSGDVPTGDESGEKEIPADGGERNAALRTDRNSERKTSVNKRNDWQKQRAGCRGEKTRRDRKK